MDLNDVNVNIVMCKNVGPNRTYENVFNTIKLGENSRISFCIVTFINLINKDMHFGIVYRLEKVNDGSNVILSYDEYKIIADEEDKKEKMESSMDYRKYNQVYLPGKGEYIVQVYLINHDEVEKINSSDTDIFSENRRKAIEEIVLDKKYACGYSFVVE